MRVKTKKRVKGSLVIIVYITIGTLLVICNMPGK